MPLIGERLDAAVTCTGDERGSVVPVTAIMLVICVMSLIGVSRLGDAAVRRARADAAADVIALAAVQAGVDGARSVAAAAGASVDRQIVRADGSVMVEVVLSGVSATAAAAPLGAELRGGPDRGTGRR